MTWMRRHRSLAMGLAYFNAAWNLLLFALNPAWGSIVLAWICMAIGAYFTGVVLRDRRRDRMAAQRHHFLMRPQPRLPDPFRRTPHSVVVLGPGERIIPIPQVGGTRKPQVPARDSCNHWPRDAVKLNDGTTVGYICRRCDHNWVDENYVSEGQA